MDKKIFWEIIGQPVEDNVLQIEVVAERLAKYPLKEIILFDDILGETRGELLQIENGISEVLKEKGLWCSDDGFAYFLTWIITKGKEVVEDIVREPKSLRDLLKGYTDYPPENAGFMYIGDEALELKKKRIMDEDDMDEDRLLISMSEDKDLYDFRQVLKMPLH